jgi:DNA polymerase III subunit delta'
LSAAAALRPAAGLADVVGHADAKTRLWRLAEGGRLPNGLLLAGADGRGKRTLALAFARELLRRHAAPGDAERAARRAEGGLHPELILLEPLPDERFLPVRRVRRLLERCSLTIGEGSLRAVVLPRLHRLNEESANALLKFLEEPPPGTIVLATTSDAGAVMETIRSRLRIHPVGPLADADVARVLASKGFDPAEAALLAPAAEGAPGAAFRLRRGDLEAALLTPLRELFDANVSAYAWAERRAKEAKDEGADWTAAEEAIGPTAAVAAFQELRAAKEEGVEGEKTGAATLEAARAWLRPLLSAATFVARDLVRRAHALPMRAPALAEKAAADRACAATDAGSAEAAVRAAAAALENLDRNLSLPLVLETAAAAFRRLPA